MYDGVKLKQSFVGTGYSDEVRHIPGLCVKTLLHDRGVQRGRTDVGYGKKAGGTPVGAGT